MKFIYKYEARLLGYLPIILVDKELFENHLYSYTIVKFIECTLKWNYMSINLASLSLI